MNYVAQLHPTDDRLTILDLWRKNLPLATAGRYAWMYESGPARSWLARADSGAPIGSTGLMAREMKLLAATGRAGQAIDLNVDHEHRSCGPAIKLQRALTQSLAADSVRFVYAVPSPSADPIMRRVGYQVAGALERWVKPLRCEYRLRGRFKFARAVRPIAFVIDQLLKLNAGERMYHRRPGVTTETVMRFDGRFDRLWQVAAGQFGIAGDRSAKYLNWRYAECPDVKYYAFCVLDAERQLRGYVVYHLDGRFACISDLLFTDEQALDDVIAEFIRALRFQPVDAVSMLYFGTNRIGRVLQRFGFSRRQTPRQLYIYAERTTVPDRLATWLDRENWYFTKADSDTDV